MKNMVKNPLKTHREPLQSFILIGVMIMFIIFSSGLVSAADWDNVLTYTEEDLKVTFDNTILGIPFLPIGEIGTIELKSHKTVDEVIDVGIGGGRTVMYYDFDFKNKYEGGLGEVIIINMETGEEVFPNYYFSYLGDVEVNDYKQTCSNIKDLNGTTYEECNSEIVGTHTTKDWIKLDINDIPEGKTRIALMVDMPKNKYYDAVWTITGKKVKKHAGFSSWLIDRRVACWTLDETSGTNMIDYSAGQLNNGTNSAATVGADSQTASLDKAYQFTGTGVPISSNLATLNITGNLTLGVVMNVSSTNRGMAGGTINAGGYKLQMSTAKGFFQTTQTSSANVNSEGLSALTTGNDVLVIGTYYAGVNQKIYINDSLETTTTVGIEASLKNSPAFSVGQLGTGGDFMTGYISEVWVMNYTMNATDVADIYNSGAIVSCKTPAVTSPTITLVNPTDTQSFLTSSVTFATLPSDPNNLTGLNVTIYTNASGTWEINGSSNSSSYNNTQTNFTASFPIGVYLWNALVSDGADEAFAATNRTFTVTKLVYLNQSSYDNQTFEQTSVNFKQNFTVGTGYSPTDVKITYNQTNYSASFSSINTSSYQASATLTTPEVNANTNMTFNWTVELDDSSFHISSSNLQQVNNFDIDNCSNNTVKILNLTLADEDTLEILNVTTYNTSIKIDLSLYSDPALSNLILQYSHLFNETNTSEVCMNSSLASNILYQNAQIEYSAGIYASEFYNIQNYSLNSTSNPSINLTLYDVLSSESTPYKITYKDSSFLPISSALIQVQRKYVDEGIYRTVEVPMTDIDGQTTAHLITDDVIYTFTVVKNGVILATFTSQNAVCQNPTITECVINLNSFLSSIDVTDFEDTLDFSSSLSYNSTSKVVSSTFTVPSGSVSYISLNVTQEDALGTNVCSSGVTTSASTLTCTVPAGFGNSTVRAILYKDGTEIVFGQFKLDKEPSDIYDLSLVALALFLMITLIGASFSDNPVFTVVFFMVGVILLFALNLVSSNGFIGAGATILWLIVAIIILLIKGSNRS